MSKILVAEDNAPNRDLMREIMESRGHEVIEARDGQEALDKLEQTSLDLVLLDTSLAITVRAPRFALTMRPHRLAW